MSYNNRNKKVPSSILYRLRKFELRIFFQIVQFLCFFYFCKIQIVHGLFVCVRRKKKIKDNCTLSSQYCVQPQHADLTLGATGNRGI